MSEAGTQIQLQDGRLLGYTQTGDPSGKPVFFFQGTPSSRLFHPDGAVTAVLGVCLITIDRPGFGLSDFQPGRTLLDWPDDVAEVADRWGFDRCHPQLPGYLSPRRGPLFAVHPLAGDPGGAAFLSYPLFRSSYPQDLTGMAGYGIIYVQGAYR